MNPKTLKIEYKLIHKEFFLKKVNQVCNQGVDFDDTFKADNYILLYQGQNEMIGWKIKNFIAMETNVVSKYIKP